MTRELKAGMVIAGSFLTLVGVVFLSRLKNPEGAVATADSQAGVVAPDAPRDGKPEEKSAPTNEPTSPTHGPVPTQEVPKFQPTPKGGGVVQLVSGPSDTKPPGTPNREPDPPVAPPPVTSNEPKEPASPPTLPGRAEPPPTPVLPTLPGKPEATPPEPAAAAPPAPAVPVEAGNREPVKPLLPLPPPPGEEKAAAATPKAEPPAPEPPNAAPKPEPQPEPPPAPVGGPGTSVLPTLPPLGGSPSPTPPPASDKKLDEPMPAAPVTPPSPPVLTPEAKPPAAPETPPTPKLPTLPVLAPPTNPAAPEAGAAPRPPAGPTPPSSNPPAPTPPAPETPPVRPMPPLGAPATAVGPPITAPLPTPRLPAGVPAQVESYDEETYRLKPGDTYRSISIAFFNTEKYERALTLFNRNHPQASDGARLDPPVLSAGQPVFLPPARILEKYYGAEAAEPAPSAPPSVGLQPPRAVVPPARPAAAGGEGGTYQVPAGGEMFLQIARRALGDGERWVEIYRLNPQYNPKAPVPGGTVLRLPK